MDLEKEKVEQNETAEQMEAAEPVEDLEQPEAVEQMEAAEPVEVLEQPDAVEQNPIEPVAEEVPEVAAEPEQVEAAPEQVEAAPEAEVPVPVEKKPMDKQKLMKIGVVAGAAAIVVFLLLFFTVIKPNATYRKAEKALNSGDFATCQQLLNTIPNHRKAPDLHIKLTVEQARTLMNSGSLDQAEAMLMNVLGNESAKKLADDIIYKRAALAISQGKLDEAKEHLDKIPSHEDPDKLRSQLKYAMAAAAADTGDYETAYALYSELGEYEDAVKQKEVIYYEALAFKSLFAIQKTLKNPASLRVTDVTFYKDSTTEGELDFISNITASNSYGGSVGGYVYDLTLYDGDNDAGMLDHSSYVDPDDYLEALEKLLIDAIRKQTVLEVTVDVARMNRLLKDDVTFKVDLPFTSGTTVQN